MSLDDLVRRSIVGRKPPSYPGDEAGFLRMDANTNLIGENPAAGRWSLAQYPSAVSAALREALAKKHGVEPAQVIVGVGSDGLLDYIMKAFVNPDDAIAVPSPSFVMYGFYARINLGRIIEVPLSRPDFALDVDALLATRAKLTMVASPNNPTGNAFPGLEKLLGAPTIAVIDEAYADFCGQDFTRRPAENLIVLRTFSKAYGLAGLRVGYAIGSRELIDRLYCVKPPFDVGTIGEAIALEALGDDRFLRETVETVRKERSRLSSALAKLGYCSVRSDANFLLVDVERGREAREFLYAKKILTRDLSDFPGLGAYLRVTVGRPEDNDRFLGAMKEWKSSR